MLDDLQSPRTTVVSVSSEVVTFSGPGKRAFTTPAAAMAPIISETTFRAARVQLMLPMSAMARMTAGLNRPVQPISVVTLEMKLAMTYLH